MTFLFSFTECNLLCWCCHATATAPIPPKSHPLSFLDLSVSGVACRLHIQKRLQVCGYTTGIMEGNAKHSTTYHNFRYCSCFASSSSQFCTTSHWNKDNYSKQNWWFLLAATLNMSELRCLKLILKASRSGTTFACHFLRSHWAHLLKTTPGGKFCLPCFSWKAYQSRPWAPWVIQIQEWRLVVLKRYPPGNNLTYATSNMPWLGICELCRRGNIFSENSIYRDFSWKSYLKNIRSSKLRVCFFSGYSFLLDLYPPPMVLRVPNDLKTYTAVSGHGFQRGVSLINLTFPTNIRCFFTMPLPPKTPRILGLEHLRTNQRPFFKYHIGSQWRCTKKR